MFVSIRLLPGSIQRFYGKISNERRMLRKQRIQLRKECWYFGIIHGRGAFAQLPNPFLDWVEFHDHPD